MNTVTLDKKVLCVLQKGMQAPATVCRQTTIEAADRLELTREMYVNDNETYEVLETLHYSYLKDKMVSNARSSIASFIRPHTKFRTF